ncbi:MAG: diacylglycerol kinase family protein [Bacteroidales bacterium]
MNKNWFIIANPRAGGGKGKKDWPAIERLLAKYDVDYKVAFTEFKHHAVEITVKAINNGYTKIVALGGDGTLNEVLNGIFIQKRLSPDQITIGVIAVGTGNDWFRTYKIPSGYEDCIKAIKSEHTFKQDVGKVEYWEAMINHSRYFANAAGIGFDAEVARRTNRLKDLGKRGTILYLISLLKALIWYRTTKIDVTIDGSSIQERVFSLTLGIGKYNGAGMMQAPNAILNDGLYDITLIRKIDKLGVIKNIHRLYNGTILAHPKISNYRGSVIEITSDPVIMLEADGESLGESPFRFTILPEAITVVVGEEFLIQTKTAQE